MTASNPSWDYPELIAALCGFREERLGGLPSDRTLARAAGVSPTTVGHWLRVEQFPRQVDELLTLVRAVALQAERVGLASESAVAKVLEVGAWRSAYRAEAKRRATNSGLAIRAEQGRAVLERMRLGRPLGEVTDPFALEVHHAIDSTVEGQSSLPAYVRRAHDDQLAKVVAQAASGGSRIAVLVGDSSTGKTRACWEALRQLRQREEPWRLWHPIDPTRADAMLADLPHLAPYTVLWLNEAQLYLTPGDGERVTAGLRTLLSDSRRAPVLVLATLWHSHWSKLTARAEPDHSAQSRELLSGHKITVPGAFTGPDLAALHDQAAASGDPRLMEAARRAADGEITQYLAGVPVLLDRYRDAPAATRGLIHAAMDARRLGAGIYLPLSWLADAALGYLTHTQLSQTRSDWLTQALEYVTTPCNGIPGLLSPLITAAPRNQRTRRTAGATTNQGPHLLLTDYLEQYGRQQRHEIIPPIDFWTSAADHAPRADLVALGDSAWARGLYRDASQLHKHAVAHNRPNIAITLINRLRTRQPSDQCPTRWAATEIPLDAPGPVAALMETLQEAGMREQLATLLARNPAAHVPLDQNFSDVALLLAALKRAKAQDQIDTLLARNPAASVPLQDHRGVKAVLTALQTVEAEEQIRLLLARAATDTPLDDDVAITQLLVWLRHFDAQEPLAALLSRNPGAHTPVSKPRDVAKLLDALEAVEAHEQITPLLERVAASTTLDDPMHVVRLMYTLRALGAEEHIVTLLQRTAANGSVEERIGVAYLLHRLQVINNPEHSAHLLERAVAECSLADSAQVAWLLRVLQRQGAQELIDAVLAREPARHAGLDRADAVEKLLQALTAVGAHTHLTALSARAATHAPLRDPAAVSVLLASFREVGAQTQVASLLARDPAAHADLHDAGGVKRLLLALAEAEAHQQVAALLKRAASHTPMRNPATTAKLLATLRKHGTHEQVATLLARDPATHADIHSPTGVAQLLQALAEADAHDQITTLLERDPATNVFLHSASSLTALRDAYRAVGAPAQLSKLLDRAAAHFPLRKHSEAGALMNLLVQDNAPEPCAVLADRLPAAGFFELLLAFGTYAERYRFGREPDGRPAEPWSWADLE
ncbi:hypothetical protein ACFUTV_40810 [Streptomyces sp. NPDC057298]|uniref:hypothetical protein n=1 Tax=Streptomyces sp. NPDC057298 TaxID=3346091 RepID=UPI00363C7CAD